MIKSLPPISLVLMQLKKQWERSAMMGAGQSVQLEVLFGRILDNLSSVGKRWWTNFHRKLVASDPNPFSLHLLHVLSQSFVGEESSALDMMKSLWLSSNWCMVTSSSTRSL